MKKTFAIVLAAILLCLTALPVCAQSASENEAESLLVSCTGYAGTAGSSLKDAVRAERILAYAVDNSLANGDAQAFAQELAAAYDALSDEQRFELNSNMMNIFGVLDAAFTDYLSVEGLLDSAGILESIRLLLCGENAQAHYNVFKITMLDIMGEFDNLFAFCTGYAAAAGSSLKSARAACGVLRFCVERGIAFAEPTRLKEVLLAAYHALSEESRQELAWNMNAIFNMVDGAFADDEALKGLFDDAGVSEDMARQLARDDAYAHWAVFRLQMQAVLDQADQ